MAQKIVAGNWKMNLDATSAQQLISEVIHMTNDEYQGDAQVIFSPSFPFLGMVNHQIKDHERFHLSAQNLHQEEKGAYTGEVAGAMLKSVGCSYVIIGHSERRQYFHEDNALLAKKIDVALTNGLKPIYCIGETLEERNAGKTLQVNERQLSEGAFHLSGDAFSQLVIAYEPVWCIGTGVSATPEDAQEVHASIRQLIEDKYGKEISLNTTILYGGSVKPHTAPELFAQKDIDGGLIGGASLKSRDFVDIIKAFA
ncbi:MAG: triose-phosphate isomerase [Bacteroidia bacterium]|nr:triose-phosphate isomerase [Bacteroidia bacterium]